MPVYRIDLGYDGAPFYGFARQPGLPTVQGAIEDALARRLGRVVETVGAGRTDKGVHARHQVVSFGTEPFDADRVERSLRRMLAPSIAVYAVRQAPDAFDARFSATWRSYRYEVVTVPAVEPARAPRVWHRPGRLDFDAMNEAARGFLGEHDFAAFCRRAPGRTTVRNVLGSRWEAAADGFVYHVRASAFCHQMVRSLVGFCVEVGAGRFAARDVADVISAGDRSRAGQLAPARGLTLWEVGYDELAGR